MPPLPVEPVAPDTPADVSVESPDPAFTAEIKQTLQTSQAAPEDVASYAGIYGALAKAVEKPEFQTSVDVDTVQQTTTQDLGIKLRKYPAFSDLLGGRINMLTSGKPDVGNKVPLTPELREKYRKLFEAAAMGCRQALAG